MPDEVSSDDTETSTSTSDEETADEETSDEETSDEKKSTEDDTTTESETDETTSPEKSSTESESSSDDEKKGQKIETKNSSSSSSDTETSDNESANGISQSSDSSCTSSSSSSDSSDEADGLFSKLKEKWDARKTRKKAEKEAKNAPPKPPKLIPITWYYTDLPVLTSEFGFKPHGTEHAMIAVGICTKTRPNIKADPHNVDDTLVRLLESSAWDEMGHWDKKGRFTKAKMKRRMAKCDKGTDFSGPPRNMTDHIYIDHAIHPSTPFAHFSGGPITKMVLGQFLYVDFADTIDKFKRPYATGNEETGLKEDGYFIFVYTMNKV